MRIAIRRESGTAGRAAVILCVVRLHITMDIIMAFVALDRDTIARALAQMIVVQASPPATAAAPATATPEVRPLLAHAEVIVVNKGTLMVASEADPVRYYGATAAAPAAPTPTVP